MKVRVISKTINPLLKHIERYVIATKSTPLKFENNDCYDVEDIQEASFYEKQKDAELELSRFDEPDKHRVLKVAITYRLS